MLKHQSSQMPAVGVICFQGSMLNANDGGVINDIQQLFNQMGVNVVGYDGVGGKSQDYFILDVMNKVMGGLVGEWLCNPTTNSNVDKAAKYVRNFRQKHGDNSIIMLIGYSRGSSAISRLCQLFPNIKFVVLSIDPVNPQGREDDDMMPPNVIVNIEMVASEIISLPIVYYTYIYHLFYSRFVCAAEKFYLPFNHAQIGGRKERFGWSINDQGKVCNSFSTEDNSVEGMQLRKFMSLWVNVLFHRISGNINQTIENELFKAVPPIEKICQVGYNNNCFVNGKRVVDTTSAISVKRLKTILTNVSEKITVTTKENKQTGWNFFFNQNKHQYQSSDDDHNAWKPQLRAAL